jgi:hypothetical protein
VADGIDRQLTDLASGSINLTCKSHAGTLRQMYENVLYEPRGALAVWPGPADGKQPPCNSVSWCPIEQRSQTELKKKRKKGKSRASCALALVKTRDHNNCRKGFKERRKS